jgi:hypothetical protein
MTEFAYSGPLVQANLRSDVHLPGTDLRRLDVPQDEDA